jgi:hypothetical protein
LRSIVGSDFAGDPLEAHSELVAAIKRSSEQAEAFSAAIGPMKAAAERVFQAWTEDLESFGSTKMRQQSQGRLEETRARYGEIVTAAVAAQITYDALNADLSDHALFLEHDFNAEAVGLLAGEVDSLRERTRELNRRLDACAAAAKAYVESAALRGQLAEEAPVAKTKAKPGQKSALSGQPKAKSAPAKTALAKTPADEAEATAAVETEEAEPAPAPSTPGGTR